MIEQATISNKKHSQVSQVRYNFDTGILYLQNRSYDSILTLEEYNNMKNKTIESAKIRGDVLTFKIIQKNEPWITLKKGGVLSC